MKLNLHHGNDYLSGYVNLETREGFRTDQRVSSYAIEKVSMDHIVEIVANVGTFESSIDNPMRLLSLWHELVNDNCALKIKAIDSYALATSFAKNLITIDQFSSLIKGNNQILDVEILSESIKKSGFVIERSWYGPYQWIINIQARKS